MHQLFAETIICCLMQRVDTPCIAKGTVASDFLYLKRFRQKYPTGPLIHDLKQFWI
jgi:hypothetical protein